MKRPNINTEEERAIVLRIESGAPFTFSELWSGNERVYRTADGLIQKYRKQGIISFVREGRRTVWSLTDEGKEFILKGGDA